MSPPKPYYEDSAVTIYHGECREILPHLTAALVVVDPPYGTGGRRRGEAGQGRNPIGGVVREAWDDGRLDWLTLLPPNAPWMVFWPSSRILPLVKAANDLGREKVRQLFWKKLDPMPQPGGRSPFSVEPIWLLSREGYGLNGPDWFEDSTPREGRDSDATGHPYQKPIGVMLWLVGMTTAETILDPFMGSGTTLRAAKDLNRRAIGIEKDERWCEIASRRMGQEVLQLGV